MDFDLRHFYKSPPRFREDVKAHMHALATSFVKRTCMQMRALQIDRLLTRHVPLIIFQICQDPITKFSRNGLSTQTCRVKSLSKVFHRTLHDTMHALQHDKYGDIDKKIVKGTQIILQAHGLKSNFNACVLIAACVAEMCGIMLNAARQDDKKTITIELLQEYSTKHVLSSGELCTNISLVRFLNSIQKPLYMETKSAPPPQKRKRDVGDVPHHDRHRFLEEKCVSFSAGTR